MDHKKNLAMITGISLVVLVIASFITYPPLARLAGLSVFLFSLGLYGLWVNDDTRNQKSE